MATPVNYEVPDYNPEPIDKLDPSIMGLKTLEEYMDTFDKELGELKEMQLKGTAKDFTKAKRNRKHALESKFFEFQVEREIRLANREKAGGGSKRENLKSMDTGNRSTENSDETEEDFRDALEQGVQLDRPRPKKGDYPAVGPSGPGDLNIEGDWEGPIELFEFGWLVARH